MVNNLVEVVTLITAVVSMCMTIFGIVRRAVYKFLGKGKYKQP